MKNTTMRTLSSPTGPNELFTILAMAWQAMTALTTIDPNSSVCQPEENKGEKTTQTTSLRQEQHKCCKCIWYHFACEHLARSADLPRFPGFATFFPSFSLSFFLSFFTPFFLPGSPICSLSLLLLDDDDSSHKQNRRSKVRVLESSRGKSRSKASSSCFASFPLLLLSSVVFFTSVVRA